MTVPGEVYVTKIAYEDDPTTFKWRPVLVINSLEGVSTIVEISSIPPRNPPTFHDTFKVPIRDFVKAGLRKKSFVRTHMVYNVEDICLRGPAGIIDNDELINIQARVLQTREILCS
jgi:hypothetical protein